MRQQVAKVMAKGPAEGNEEAVEDAFAAEINTRVVRLDGGEISPFLYCVCANRPNHADRRWMRRNTTR